MTAYQIFKDSLHVPEVSSPPVSTAPVPSPVPLRPKLLYICVQPHVPELSSNFAEECRAIKLLGLEAIPCLFLPMQCDITVAQNKDEPPQTQSGQRELL